MSRRGGGLAEFLGGGLSVALILAIAYAVAMGGGTCHEDTTEVQDTAGE